MLLILLMVAPLLGQEGTCDREDKKCQQMEENRFKSDESVPLLLAEVKELEKISLSRALEQLKKVAKEYPDNADVLLHLSQLYRTMYGKLHPKMRDVGKQEWLTPSLEICTKLLKLPAPHLSDEQHAVSTDFCVANVLGIRNRTSTVMMIQTSLERMNPKIDQEDYKYYFDLLVEEMFYAKKYEEALDLIKKVSNMFPGPNIEVKLIGALIHRYNEIVNNQPFVVSHDALKKIAKGTDDDKRNAIMFVSEMEQELRKENRLVEVDTLFELCEEMGMFPSKYQRANMLVNNLKAKPVWSIEETGQQENFKRITDNFKQIQKELKNLTVQLDDDDWTENLGLESRGLWSQFFFLGNGRTSMPPAICEGVTPTFCEIIRSFTATTKCALCEVKLEFFEPGAHLTPSCGPTNAKLRAFIPITPPGRTGASVTSHATNNSNATEIKPDSVPGPDSETDNKTPNPPSFRVRVGDSLLNWEEGEVTVWDNSFEHEVWNQSGDNKLVLVVDFKHPDLQPEDDIMDPRMWTITEVEGSNAVYQMRTEMIS